jgi:hypothetical protein
MAFQAQQQRLESVTHVRLLATSVLVAWAAERPFYDLTKSGRQSAKSGWILLIRCGDPGCQCG